MALIMLPCCVQLIPGHIKLQMLHPLVGVSMFYSLAGHGIRITGHKLATIRTEDFKLLSPGRVHPLTGHGIKIMGRKSRTENSKAKAMQLFSIVRAFLLKVSLGVTAEDHSQC